MVHSTRFVGRNPPKHILLRSVLHSFAIAEEDQDSGGLFSLYALAYSAEVDVSAAKAGHLWVYAQGFRAKENKNQNSLN